MKFEHLWTPLFIFCLLKHNGREWPCRHIQKNKKHIYFQQKKSAHPRMGFREQNMNFDGVLGHLGIAHPPWTGPEWRSWSWPHGRSLSEWFNAKQLAVSKGLVTSKRTVAVFVCRWKRIDMRSEDQVTRRYLQVWTGSKVWLTCNSCLTAGSVMAKKQKDVETWGPGSLSKIYETSWGKTVTGHWKWQKKHPEGPRCCTGFQPKKPSTPNLNFKSLQKHAALDSLCNC